LEPKEPERMW